MLEERNSEEQRAEHDRLVRKVRPRAAVGPWPKVHNTQIFADFSPFFLILFIDFPDCFTTFLETLNPRNYLLETSDSCLTESK